MDHDMRSLVTVPEAARYCGVDRVTMWRWVKSGDLAAFVTPGGHHRINRRDLEAFLRRKGLFPDSDTAPRKRILVVRDDTRLRNRLVALLAEQGYDVTGAADGFTAGREVEQLRPDAVILDAITPGLDILTVCRSLRDDPSTADVRVVVLGGYRTDASSRLLYRAGVDAFFLTPVDEHAFIIRLSELLADTEELADSQKIYSPGINSVVKQLV